MRDCLSFILLNLDWNAKFFFLPPRNLNSPFSKQMTESYDGVMWPTFHMDKPLSTVKILVRAKKYEEN